MKKAAICFRGAMAKINSRFELPNKVYQTGSYINFKACHQSIFKHIVNANPNYEFDFFIHSWNQDLQDQLVLLYNPKQFLFEDNLKYSQEILSKSKEPKDFGGISSALSMKKSIELLEQQQLIYDIVILFRPDLLIIKDMILNNYDINKIYVNDTEDHSLNGDFHFIMNLANISQFKSLYHSIELGNKHQTHFWIYNYVKHFMHKELVLDNIMAGFDEEVIRKINGTMVLNNGISISTLLEYGLTKDEINIYNS